MGIDKKPRRRVTGSWLYSSSALMMTSFQLGLMLLTTLAAAATPISCSQFFTIDGTSVDHMHGQVKLPLAERGTSDAPNIEFWNEYSNASDVLTVSRLAQPASTYTLFHTARKPSHSGQPARTYWFQMAVRAFPYEVTAHSQYDSWRKQANKAVSAVESLAPVNWSSCVLTDMRFYDIVEGQDDARQIDLANSHHLWGSDLAFCETGLAGVCVWAYLVDNSNIKGEDRQNVTVLPTIDDHT